MECESAYAGPLSNLRTAAEARKARWDVNRDPLHDDDGRVVGPDLGAALNGYLSGRVPWGTESGVEWRLPSPRHYLDLRSARFPEDVWKRYRKRGWKVRLNHDLTAVIDRCAHATRRNDVLWITDDLRAMYLEFERAGLAWSIEVYEGETLISGEFGLPLGGTFFCESKFHDRPGSGSFCSGSSVLTLAALGFQVYDAQYGPPYLNRFSTRGLEKISADEFPALLAQAHDYRFRWMNQGLPTTPAEAVLPGPGAAA